MVLDVEAGRWTLEKYMGHHQNILAQRYQTMIYRKVPVSRQSFGGSR
jgi:hypothetical protein